MLWIRDNGVNPMWPLFVSRWLVYTTLFANLIVAPSLFFPFITGKVLFFRTIVELALVFFFVFIFFNADFRKEVLKRLKNPLFLAVGGYVLIFLITSLISVSPSSSFWSNYERAEGGWQMIHYFAFFALASILFSSKKDWLKLFRCQAIIGFFVCAYGLLQLINNPPPWIIAPGRISGTLGNPSYLSIFIIFNIFFALWLVFNEEVKELRWLWGIFIALFTFTLFLAKTDAAFVATAIGIFTALVLTTIRAHRRHQIYKNQRGVLTWCYVGSLAIILLLAIGIVYFLQLDTHSVQVLLATLKHRSWTWSAAVAGIIEKPLLGWGVENFPIPFDKYYSANHYGVESWFDRAHNIILEQLINGGVVLLLAFLAIFYFLYKKLWTRKEDGLWPIVFVMPLIYLINGLALFEILPMYLMFFLFLAFAINYSSDFQELSFGPIDKGNILKWVLTYLVIVIFCFSLFFTIYLPLQKNRLIIEAARSTNKTLKQVLLDHEKALLFYSPIGQAETTQQLLNFGGEVISWLKDQPLDDKDGVIKNVVDFNGFWFEKNKNGFIGVKNLYLYLDLVMRAAEVTKSKDYYNLAKELIAEGEKLAPSRLEFLIAHIKIAEKEDDKTLLKQLINKGKALRPDLDWSTTTK